MNKGRHCPNCGQKVSEDAEYCSNCGFKLLSAENNNDITKTRINHAKKAKHKVHLG